MEKGGRGREILSTESLLQQRKAAVMVWRIRPSCSKCCRWLSSYLYKKFKLLTIVSEPHPPTCLSSHPNHSPLSYTASAKHASCSSSNSPTSPFSAHVICTYDSFFPGISAWVVCSVHLGFCANANNLGKSNLPSLHSLP